MSRLVLVLVTGLALGCASHSAVTPATPNTASPSSEPREPAPVTPRSVLPAFEGVPVPKPECSELASHAVASCNPSDPAKEALAAALEVTNEKDRDARLACLEANTELPPGMIRALRAEFANVGCGDSLTIAFLDAKPTAIEPRIKDALLALGIAGRLSRLVHEAPRLPPPFSKADFLAFLKAKLTPWILAQANAIQDLSAIGAGLSSYAKGIVAVEAGLADMRFVTVVRDVPLPEELKTDPEIKDVYYMALEEALEPRKTRGRDATLVGLRILAKEGILGDARIQRARSLLSELYSGRRVDALDRLLLPPLPPLSLTTVEQRLAKALPTFYVSAFLDSRTLDPTQLRALMERGIPPALEALYSTEKATPELRDLYARALFTRGQRYFRADDFAQAERAAESGTPNDSSAFLAALAMPLKSGPKDASDVLLRGPFLPTSLAQVAELDKIAKSPSPFAPLAAFDAAFLLSLVPPQDDPKFWTDVAQRFRKAMPRLSDPEQKALAQRLADSAAQTAKVVGKKP